MPWNRWWNCVVPRPQTVLFFHQHGSVPEFMQGIQLGMKLPVFMFYTCTSNHRSLGYTYNKILATQYLVSALGLPNDVQWWQ